MNTIIIQKWEKQTDLNDYLKHLGNESPVLLEILGEQFCDLRQLRRSLPEDSLEYLNLVVRPYLQNCDKPTELTNLPEIIPVPESNYIFWSWMGKACNDFQGPGFKWIEGIVKEAQANFHKMVLRMCLRYIVNRNANYDATKSQKLFSLKEAITSKETSVIARLANELEEWEATQKPVRRGNAVKSLEGHLNKMKSKLDVYLRKGISHAAIVRKSDVVS